MAWTNAGQNRWIRDDGDGYLQADADTLLELHGDTVHVYRRDPGADPGNNTGGPLDGYTWRSTETAARDDPPVVDALTAWRMLVRRADRYRDQGGQRDNR